MIAELNVLMFGSSGIRRLVRNPQQANGRQDP